MTTITVYDDTADALERLSNEKEISIPEIIDALMDFADELD